jgi:hypothetical protein
MVGADCQMVEAPAGGDRQIKVGHSEKKVTD